MRLVTLLVLTTAIFASESADSAALVERAPMVAGLSLPSGNWTLALAAPTDPGVARKADRDGLTTAGKAFLTAVQAAKNGPDATSRLALDQFVTVLGASAAGSRADALDPVYARRAARGGSLRGLGASAAVTALERALAEACRMLPVERWTGPGGATLDQRRDAFGIGGWVLTQPARSGKPAQVIYAMLHPAPQFLADPGLHLVVELPAGADPATDAGKATTARLFRDAQPVAAWVGGKLTANNWRAAVAEPQGEDYAPGLLPPHLVLCDLDGDVARLVVESGALAALKDGTPAEADRFVADAARLLPDTPRLDLVGQYLFRYAHDSPDPRFPTLIGGQGATGEIHQTARQTLATAAGGQCRGDCDDLGELYQTIAEKQSRMGHMLILPGHTAFATARQAGGTWTVELMQTGPTYAISAPDLPEALRLTWRKFDPTSPFSPDHLGVLLRFSGENQRGQFGLGWRIFSDPAYAKTMIDVQRDWQYQTYARAIAKMTKLVAAGDTDVANYNELASLYRTTGQWERAIDLLRQSLAKATDPESILELRRDLIGLLRRAGRGEEAKAELAKAGEDLDAAAARLGQRTPQAAMSLAMAMLAAGDQAGARTLMERRAMAPLTEMLTRIVAGVQQGALTRERWQSDGNLASVRRILGTFIGTQSALLARAGDQAATDPGLQAMRRNLDLWAARIAFLDVDGPAESLPIYASIARLHALDLGRDEFDRLIASATPATGKRDHLERPLELAAARPADLGWIALSPAYWAGLQGRALVGRDAQDDDDDEDADNPDPAKSDRSKVVALARKVVEARDRCVKLGLVSDSLEMIVHQTALVAAVIGGDDKLLRERLRFVATRKDKRLYESVSRTLGQLAPYCDTARWAAVLKAWADEVDYQPKWFAIAWTAAVAGGREQALATATMAAQRFPADKAFAEEAAFMATVLKPAAK